MSRSPVVRTALIILSLSYVWGCASPGRLNPLARFRKSADQKQEAESKLAERNPLKPAADDAKLADQNESSATADDEEPADADKTSGEVKIVTHDAETARLIEEELQNATPAERQKLRDEWKLLEPAMIRQIVSIRRMVRQMGQSASDEQITQVSAQQATGESPWAERSNAVNPAIANLSGSGHSGSNSTSTEGHAPASGLGSAGPWTTQPIGHAADLQQTANRLSEITAGSSAPPGYREPQDASTAGTPWNQPGQHNQPAANGNPANYANPTEPYGSPQAALASTPQGPNPWPGAAGQPASAGRGPHVSGTGTHSGINPAYGPQPAGHAATTNAGPNSVPQHPKSGPGYYSAAGGPSQAYQPNAALAPYSGRIPGNAGVPMSSGPTRPSVSAAGFPGGESGQPYGASIYQPPSGPTAAALSWSEDLQRLIAMAESDVSQSDPGTTDIEIRSYVEKQVYLRMLYLISGQQVRALEPIPGLEPADQEFWQQVFWGLASYFDFDAMPDSHDRATQTIIQLRSAVQRLQQRAKLELRNVTFCHKISSYGSYERFNRDEFTRGEPVLVYSEVNNFTSEPTSDGQYRTLLQSTIEIFNAQGNLVKVMQFPATEDLCRNHRRDYFHSYEFTIPTDISLGPHIMKLTVVDQLSQKVTEYSLNFTVQ